ncbi:hypothetical protein AVM02_07465 [Brucella anthropi]|uniref:DNA polymerase n=1 Tax=Brucella anthropi TaxID=529 RepID=UPI00398767C9
MADRLYIDFETRSTADLKKTGAWRYAEDPSTGVFCMAWAFNNEPTDIWIEGQPLPDRIRQHVKVGGEVHAWNAMFELAIWTRICAPRFGWPKLFISQMRDTMAAAAYWGLPLSLDMAAQASGARVQKDSAGHKLMQKLCKPRQGGTWWHEDDPSLLPGLYRYCENDVDTERAIAATIPDLPDAEQRVWEADMTINMRGVMLDMRLVNKLKAFTDWEKTELDKRMNQLTNGRATACTQTARILAFVQENNPHVTSLTKEAVEEALSGTLTPVAREVLELRQASAKSSTSKLNAMLTCVCADGRVRGLLQYYGANRTGRWAGRLVQVQNLPRPTTKRVSEIIDMVLADATPDEVGLFINPLDAVASIIRGCFAAAPGKKFFQQDLSQIEARVVAWLSGQDDILDVFARGEDVYVYTAQKMGSNDRQLGKVLVLACGFGMGWSKFQDTARTYRLYLSADEALDAVTVWRQNNPAIVSYWKTAQEACVWAIRNPGRKMAIGPKGRQIVVGVSDVGRTRGHLLVQLPSGRYLVYRNARLEQGKYGPEITYMGVNQYSRKWERLRTYGGKLVENWTQAVARDVQAEATVNIEAQIPGLVMSVHDELINENEDASGMAAIMNTPPVWAGGLPVTSDGWVGDRYRK